MSLENAPSYAGSWNKLQPRLTPWIQTLVESDMGFKSMTPVQASTLPLFLSHKDVIVEAVTGSGKTLSFVIPILEILLRRSSNRLKRTEIGAVIVSPTRELAAQIYGVIQTFLQAQPDNDDEENIKISGVQLVVGGGKATVEQDYARFQDNGPDILVGTPGRLDELLGRNGVKKSELEVLVLDEADRLLDLGFQENITSIVHVLPKQRRTGLFSATMTDALSELVRMGLRNPVRVVVKVQTKSLKKANETEDRRTPLTLQNMYLVCRPENKLAQLLRVILYETSSNGINGGARKLIVYFATCAQVNYFYKVLTKLGWPGSSYGKKISIYSLHGKQTPSRRTATFESFVSATTSGGGGDAAVLLCTDVAARGLDIPNVDVVVQYDPPIDPKSFSHRCGRTARAGRRGRAITFLHRGKEENYVEFLSVKRIPLQPYPYLVVVVDPLQENQPNTIITDSVPIPGLEPKLDSNDTQARCFETLIQSLLLSDKDCFQLSLQAYVSFIRAYSNHETSYIFPLNNEFEFYPTARSFGLIRMPKMPELGKFLLTPIESNRLFFVNQRVKWESDVSKEQQQDQDQEEESLKKRKPPSIDPPTSWSTQKQRKLNKEKRHLTKLCKRSFLYDQQQQQQEEEEVDEEWFQKQNDKWKSEKKRLKKESGKKNKGEEGDEGMEMVKQDEEEEEEEEKGKGGKKKGGGFFDDL